MAPFLIIYSYVVAHDFGAVKLQRIRPAIRTSSRIEAVLVIFTRTFHVNPIDGHLRTRARIMAWTAQFKSIVCAFPHFHHHNALYPHTGIGNADRIAYKLKGIVCRQVRIDIYRKTHIRQIRVAACISVRVARKQKNAG